jgi:two-component system cell cycle response regulator
VVAVDSVPAGGTVRMGLSADRDLREQVELRAQVRRDRVLRWAVGVSLGWVALFTVLVWLGKGRPALGLFVGDIVYAVPDAAAAVLGVIAAVVSSGRARRMWILLAIAYMLRLTGSVIWAGYAYLSPTGVPFPSWGDAAYLSQYVLIVPALLIGFGGINRLRRARGLLDSALVVLGVGAVGWRVLIEPQLDGTLTLGSATGAAYLLGDIAIVSCLIAIGVSGHRMIPYAVLLAGAAYAANAASDVGYTYLTLFASYEDDSWLNIGWQVASVLQCLAAVVAIRHRERRARVEQLDRDLTFLPVLVAALATSSLIAYDEMHGGRVGRVTLIVGALMLGGLLLRQWMTTSDRTRLAVQLQVSLREQERLAVTDALTGIYNRRFFQEMLQLEAERAGRNGAALALIVLDLDHFKQVNDTYGHPVGDAVLTQAADRIRQAARGTDIVARYGGEEFVCLLPGADEQTVLAVAERFRLALRQAPVAAGNGQHVPITVSLGGAVARPSGGAVDVEWLLNAADAALYQAKASGRDQFALAGAPVAAAS